MIYIVGIGPGHVDYILKKAENIMWKPVLIKQSKGKNIIPDGVKWKLWE